MNPRERFLAIGVLAVVVLAGGAFLFHQLFWTPLGEREASIAALQQDIEKKLDRIRQVETERVKLERWKQLSLPADPDLARREYEVYLSDLFRQSGFAAGFSITAKPAEKSSPTLPGKGPVYTHTRLPFTVLARANLANLIDMLERFYRTGLLHQIKNLSIQRPLTPGTGQQQQGELDIQMTVEAVIVSGAESRPTLLPGVDRRLQVLDVVTALRGGPAGLALGFWALGSTGPVGPRVLAQPPRQYAAIAKKNIFLGSSQERQGEEVDVARFVKLVDITELKEAWFYDQYNKRMTRLRAEPGFDTFRILDNDGETLVHGKVIRLDSRDIIFQASQNYYSMHVGQSLDEILKSPLTGDQVKGLGLAAIMGTVSSGSSDN
jgi:hypothetical protein